MIPLSFHNNCVLKHVSMIQMRQESNMRIRSEFQTIKQGKQATYPCKKIGVTRRHHSLSSTIFSVSFAPQLSNASGYGPIMGLIFKGATAQVIIMASNITVCTKLKSIEKVP
mmetsp:Transcript_25235/g.37764  ORF Transcript_25235/g.37764 Transcript_25235/m.37764 type:complete len:112 (-) Transcript_25235:23-358(-)